MTVTSHASPAGAAAPEPSAAHAAHHATVARISSAPVKSLALVAHDGVTLGREGIPGDRRFALVDADNRLANGKRIGPLVAIVPSVGEDGRTLALRFPDGTTIEDEVRLGDPVEAVFFGAVRPARAVLGPFSEALSRTAGQPLRLVRMASDGDGIDRADTAGAISIMSAAALDALAGAAGIDGAVDPRRFRMTFVIDGVAAHAEDGWLGRLVRIGDATVRPLGNVGRCAVTTQDPDTGRRTLDTLGLIGAYRGHLPSTEPLPFGVWGEVVVPGRVAIGDAVHVLEPAATLDGDDARVPSGDGHTVEPLR